MSVRNANFYNANSTRAYPIDDGATATADDGTPLPSHILVDCHLQFPVVAGRYAFVSGVTVTDRLVTVTILAADDPENAATFVPLGAVTLPKPIVPHVHYPIDPMYPGVGGFLVFENTDARYIGRFSSPAQTRLLPRCASAYSALPITSLRKQGQATGLTGLVRLVAGDDLEIVKESRVVDDWPRDVIVIRLAAAPNRNVFQDYVGPCGVRPESRNCLKEGIEAINDAVPDCDGNIEIEFVGMTPGPYESCAGITLDHSLGMTDICAAANTVQRFVGTDLCDESSSSSVSGSETSSASVPPDESSISLSSEEVCIPADLPYCDNFDSQLAERFEVISGRFEFENDESPDGLCGEESADAIYSSSSLLNAWSYTATSGSQRNIAVWDGCLATSLDKRVTVDLQLLANLTSQRNGGIVINYQSTDGGLIPVNYYLATLDQLYGKVRLLSAQASGALITVHEVSVSSPIILGDWYRMEVTTIPRMLGSIYIRVKVSGVSDPAWPAIQFDVAVASYITPAEQFGIGTDHAYTRFSFFQVEDVSE